MNRPAKGGQLAVVAVISILQARETRVLVFGKGWVDPVCDGIISGNPSVGRIGCQGEYISGITFEERHISHSVEAGFVVHRCLLTYIEKEVLPVPLNNTPRVRFL